MAELGNLFGTNATSGEQKIEVEMLDYGYIRDCNDWNQMSAIVDVLKSGKEGYYPDLIRVAEERLIELLPPKEKRRYLSLSHKTTPAEIAEAESQLDGWQRAVKTKDETIQQLKGSTSKRLAPVRGSGSGATSTHPNPPAEDIVNAVDARTNELLGILNTNQRKKFEKLQYELGVHELSLVKKQYKAGLEKTKGNESFRIADNQDAVACYSKSLAYEPTSAVVWANRAMAYIRLELFDLAEADSSVALALDPCYVKAYSRRGLVRFKRGKYGEAVQDFIQALKLDPGNAELTKLLATAREKYMEVEGIFTAVEEEEHDEEQGEEDVEVQEVTAPAHMRNPVATLELSVHHSRQGAEGLLLPAAGATLLKVGSLASVAVDSPSYEEHQPPSSSNNSTFVRINVVSDDEEDEENEEGNAGEESESHDNRNGHSVSAATATSTTFNRIAITDEDEEDSENEEEAGEDGEDSSASAEDRAAELKEQGNALLKQGDATGAVNAYTKSLRVLPTYLPSLNNRAQAHLTLKAFNLSEQDSSSVLRQEPNNVKALYRRAVALDAQQRGAEALADLKKILALDANNLLAMELHSSISAKLATTSEILPLTPPSIAPPVPPPSAACVAKPGASSQAAGEPPIPPANREVTIDVQKLRQKAQQLLGDGLNDKVIALLAQHLRAVDQPPFSDLLQSDQTSLLHLLATAYSSTEDYAHAVAVQAAILHIDPTNARALFKRAEGQLQLAAQAGGEARTAALALAEQDIEAAVAARSGGTEVLALRQKLLRLRNTLPDPYVAAAMASASNSSSSSPSTSANVITSVERSDASPAAILSPSKLSNTVSSSRQQSDAQKELGNQAMTEKNFSTAIMHYSNAIRFDDTNLAAFNNRALAHLKMHAFAQAEADASVVIGPEDGSEVGGGAVVSNSEGAEALRLKALCRRAQARRAIGEAALNQVATTDAVIDSTIHVKEGQSVLTKALQDLQRLLKLDPSNKTALVEQRLSKDALKRCEGLLAVPLAVNAKKGAFVASNTASTARAAADVAAPALASPQPSSSAGAKQPRADMGRVSAMFAPPSPSATSSSSPSSASSPSAAFGGLGMVARSSKKLGSAASDSASGPAFGAGEAINSQAAQLAGGSTPSKTTSTATAAKKTASSPTPQIVLTSAPSEPPKTVYEFERVWRGLKGRPDLFAQYLGCFKKSTYKKVLKEALSPDLVSFMWRALKDHAPSPQVQLKALGGFSSAPSFALTLSLLPEEDLCCVRAILTSLEAHCSTLPTQSEEEKYERESLATSINTFRQVFHFEFERSKKVSFNKIQEILESHVCWSIKKYAHSLSHESLLSLNKLIIEKILSFIVTTQITDQPTFAAIRLTCRKLRFYSDSCTIWKDIPLLYPNGSIRLQSFRLDRRPDIAGTEGFCMKVTCKANGSPYALKEARPFPKNEGVPYYLVREISALKTLVHCNVAPLLGVTVKANTLYMLFPFVRYTLQHVQTMRPDGTLRQKASSLSREYALPLTMQLVNALAYCHSKGVLHRNLKPKHILLQMKSVSVDESGNDFDLQDAHLYLSDFALMRSITKPEKPLTAEMTSLWYRPPEILMGSRVYNEALDIWSLGCVFAEMLRGPALFTGMSQVEQLFQIFSKLGTPSATSWPTFSAQPYFCDAVFPEWDTPGSSELSLAPHFPGISSAELDLLERCLRCCPEKRSTAAQLQAHPALLSYRTKEKLPANNGPASVEAQSSEVGSLLWHLNEAGILLPAHKVNRYVKDRAFHWDQLSSMLTRELEIQSALRRNSREKPVRRCSAYRNVILFLANLHGKNAAKYSHRSLHLAVRIFDRYLAQLVHETTDFSRVDQTARSEGCGDQDLPCLCQIAEASAAVRPHNVTTRKTNLLLALGISCLQLASKFEDVSFLDATQMLLLSGQLAELVPQREHDASSTTGKSGEVEIKVEEKKSVVKEVTVKDIDIKVELTEVGKLHAACAQLCVEDILRSEQRVLQALRFDICGPTVLDFVGYFSEECFRLVSLSLGGSRAASRNLMPELVVKETLEGAGGHVVSPLQRALGEDSFLYPHMPFLEELTAHLCRLTLFHSQFNEQFGCAQLAAAIVTLSVNLLLSLSPPKCDADLGPTAQRHQLQQEPDQVLSTLQRAVFCWSGFSPTLLQECQRALCAAMEDSRCPAASCTFKVQAFGSVAGSLSLSGVYSMVNAHTLKKSIFSEYR